MAEKLKDQFFTHYTIDRFADALQKQSKTFSKEQFIRLVFDNKWETLELKARMRHVTVCLRACLPEDYVSALLILVKIAPAVKGFEGMVLPDFVEQYGMDHWEESLNALGHFTRYSSSEFAIRPFLDQNPGLVMHYMLQWADSEHENVRRFASEGCRPRLPWAMLLPKFIVDPKPVLEVLEKLKDDPSLFVGRSVANNLNDISKDHPDLVMDVAVKWYGYSDRTNWVIKHGLRTLLKNGNKRALNLLGVANAEKLDILNLKLSKTSLKIGEAFQFLFELDNRTNKTLKVRLEYIIRFAKAYGKSSEKVFQIAEKEMPPGKTTIKRKHAFADLTTRKHYPGEHTLTVVANGERKAEMRFVLK
ncbi:MAG: DNA alkylation repair protein [Bacteroidales bacterium]|nr:DNA alkylation repair protein [Bacteroidales bacterium]